MVMLKQNVTKIPTEEVDHYIPLERRIYVYVARTDRWKETQTLKQSGHECQQV